MHVEFGGRVADDVLVVLGVVAAKEGPEAVAEVAVDVAVLVQGAVVAQDHHRRLDRRLVEGRSLPHETFHQTLMALGEHGRHGVPLGGEVEEQEIVPWVTSMLETSYSCGLVDTLKSVKAKQLS